MGPSAVHFSRREWPIQSTSLPVNLALLRHISTPNPPITSCRPPPGKARQLRVAALKAQGSPLFLEVSLDLGLHKLEPSFSIEGVQAAGLQTLCCFVVFSGPTRTWTIELHSARRKLFCSFGCAAVLTELPRWNRP